MAKSVKMRTVEGDRRIDITVRPFRDEEQADALTLVMFEESEETSASDDALSTIAATPTPR